MNYNNLNITIITTQLIQFSPLIFLSYKFFHTKEVLQELFLLNNQLFQYHGCNNLESGRSLVVDYRWKVEEVVEILKKRSLFFFRFLVLCKVFKVGLGFFKFFMVLSIVKAWFKLWIVLQKNSQVVRIMGLRIFLNLWNKDEF